jgi:hypothetical protein
MVAPGRVALIDKVAVREREARALELRRDGLTYAQIGEVLGVNRQMATRIVQRGLDRIVREPAEQIRRLELDRLDHLQVEGLNVLHRRHVVVQGGKVVKDDDGQPIVDDGPTLHAIHTVLKVQARRAKLLGLDAPAKVEAKVMSIDELDMQIATLEAELTQLDPTWPEEYRRQQEVHKAVERFQHRWSGQNRSGFGHLPTDDLPGFIAAALDLAVGLLDLTDQQRERTAGALEEFLVGQVQ